MNEVDLRKVFDRYSVQYRETTRDHAIRCPFHDEQVPSCVVNLDKGVYDCKACGAQGNALTALMTLGGLDRAEALELAAEEGLGVAGGGFSGQGRRRRRLPRGAGYRVRYRERVPAWEDGR